jgi:D-amino-acid oxidase
VADVIVVGGGIIGLTAGVRLAEKGASVELWSPVEPTETVSAVAAAVWFPSRSEPDPRLVTWAGVAYREFARQAADGVPGVRMLPTINLSRTEPWWAPATPGVETHFTAPAVEMETYLPWLQERFRRSGGQTVRRVIKSFDEVPGERVVNATGLAAGRLCGDDAVFPVRGQTVLVRNPGLTTSVRDEERNLYIHPRSADVVLGGTFQAGAWDLTPDPVQRRAIIARCTAVVPELRNAEVVGEKVGLRPTRLGGPRLEREGRIVHAYGHGGAGMTLSWGCAEEITRLVDLDKR